MLLITSKNEKVNRPLLLGIVLVLAFFYLYGNANAQVPGDFKINCEVDCNWGNNDKLECINKLAAPSVTRSVDFTWGQSSGATKYEVYFKSSSNGSWSGPIRTTTDASRRHTQSVGLDSNNHYYIKAINTNTGDFQSCSIDASFYDNIPPFNRIICAPDNVNFDSSHDGAEANCERPAPPPPPTPPSYTQASYYTQAGYYTQASYYTQSSYYTQASYAPPPPPPPPPRISNIRIINITSTTATVLWDTDIPADSQVEFCPTFSRCGTNTPIISQLTTSHTVGLTGLRPNTSYYVWAKSRSGAGALGTLGYVLFRTLSQVSPPPPQPPPPPLPPPPPPSATPPVVLNVQLTNITRGSVTISWDTDVSADSHVYVCRSLFFCRVTASDLSLTTNHSMDVTGLRSDSNYYFIVVSYRSGVYGRSSWATFRTALGLAISNVKVVSITQTTLTVMWDTNYPSSSELRVCNGGLFCWGGVSVITDTNLTLSHSLTLPNLIPGRRYYYQVISIDSFGNIVGSRYVRITMLN